MFSIMIIEDEQIERETLYKIIKDSFPQCEQVVCAKNGKEALTLYEECHANIILADINIPGLNGLEVIRRIKAIDKESEFLILSSYNYFEYAQEAIRLGAEDFILKPYNISHLKEALQKVIQHVDDKRNESIDKSELLEKIEKITPVLENECLYGILANEDELILRKSLRLLSPMICSGFCLILKGISYEAAYIEEIANGFKDMGYRCIKELFHGLQIFYILGNHALEKDDIMVLSSYIESLKKEDYQYGIGPVESDIAYFHHSFIIARDRIGESSDVFEQLINDSKHCVKEDLNMERYIERFLQIFTKMDEEGLKKVLSQLGLQLIPLDKEQILTCVSELFTNLKEKVQEEYPLAGIQEMDIPPLKISTNIYQEVPLFLHFHIHRIYDAIVKERFKNTNLLVKQAIHYIDHNYRKQITLSDMAEALQVSPYYLSKLLNNSTNKTFTELVSERRVEASKELLKTNKRIKEIAYEVGFQGQNYFTKIFKKYTGVTPKIYKNTFDEQ